jgi:hypothetical protein
MPATKKFTPEIDAKLCKEFVAVAKRNGQSQRHVLEEALKFYLHTCGSGAAVRTREGNEGLRAVGCGQP